MIDWLRRALGPAEKPESSECPLHEDGGLEAARANRGRNVEIGWLVDAPKAEFLYQAPRPVWTKHGGERHPKAVEACPAVIDHEVRMFEILCPVDLRLAFDADPSGKPILVRRDGPRAALTKAKLDSMVHLVDRARWREEDKPVIQISAPYRFVADEPVWMSQVGPHRYFRGDPLPGITIGGRFPIHVWPRNMMWAFEWHDTDKELVLRRGEPLFYVQFETETPERPLRLVEAEMTPELRKYCDGMEGVVAYTKGTFSLFETAEKRRPPRLLKKADRPWAGDAG